MTTREKTSKLNMLRSRRRASKNRPLRPINPQQRPVVDYESEPLTRAEYLQAVIHYYRGELSRVNTWRLRLDQTTNWSVFTTAAVLSFAFNSSTHSHVVLLLGNLLLLVLLSVEARRFRFFDVWRARLRKLEENFYGPILRRDPQSPEPSWGNLVAQDLLSPHFKITYFQAFRRRLLKNYIPIFLITFLAWFGKVAMHPVQAESLPQIADNMGIGSLPGWVTAIFVGCFYLFLVGCVLYERVHVVEGENWGLEQPLQPIDQ